MRKFEIETERILLAHEKEVFDNLKETYAEALKEVKKEIRSLQGAIETLEKSDLENKSVIQSKIYRLNYQKALEEQLNASMDLLNSKNVSNINLFLTRMYEDSYLGINYCLNKQGMPIVTAINPSLIVRTVNKPVEKLIFSARLYKNMKHLKKTVKAEISRGIAEGKSYADISKRIARLTEADFNKAYRIARTEGGRVSSEARLTSMRDAREKGADVVKVWNAILDHKTRHEHGILDHQVREIDEEFEVKGMKALAPHGFGIAEMDVNCRCTLSSVPRWDLEEENERIDNITKDIVKVKDYTSWKKQYYSNEMFEYMKYIESKYEKYGTHKFETMLISLSDREYKTFSEKMNKAFKIKGE